MSMGEGWYLLEKIENKTIESEEIKLEHIGLTFVLGWLYSMTKQQCEQIEALENRIRIQEETNKSNQDLILELQKERNEDETRI